MFNHKLNFINRHLIPLLAIAVVACNSSHNSHNEITKIEVVTGSCFGPCQSTIVSVDDSLNYKYYGGRVSMSTQADEVYRGKLRGFYKAKVSQAFWDSLNRKFEEVGYKKLDSVYSHSVDDQYLEFVIHYNDSVRLIRAHSASLPRNVAEVVYWVANSYKTVKPKKTNDSLKFELGEEPLIPMPDLKGVRFLPPTKENQKNND